MTDNKQNPSSATQPAVLFKRDASAVAILIVLVLLAVHPMVFSGRLSLMNDNININIPRHVFIHNEIRAGRFPVWNPLVLCGTPVESFFVPSNPYNPILMPAMLIKDPIGSYRFLICFWLTLAAVFFYVFLRAALRMGPAASVAGAVVFALNGFFIARLEHPEVMVAVLWAPLALTGAIKWLRDRRVFWLLFLSMALAMQFFGSHILFSAMCVMLISFIWLFWNCIRGSEDRKRDIKGLAGIAGAILLSVAAAALVLGPFLSHAANYPVEPGLVHWRFKTHIEGALGLRHIAAFFLPGVFGSHFNHTNWTRGAYWHEASGYIGFAAALLVFGTGRRHLGRMGLFFVCAALFGALVSLGASTPAGLLVLNLPVFNFHDYPGRFLFFWSFGISAAAAIALNSLMQSDIQAKKSHRIAAATTVLIAVILLAFPKIFIAPGLALLKALVEAPGTSGLAGKLLSGADIHGWAFYQHKFTVEVFPSLRAALIGASLNIAGVAMLLILHNRLRRVIGALWVLLLFLSLCQVVFMLAAYSPAGLLKKPPPYLSAVSSKLGGGRLLPASQAKNEFVWPYRLETDTIYGVPITRGYLHFHPLAGDAFPRWDRDCRYFAPKFMTLVEGETRDFPNCSTGKLVAAFKPHPATASKEEFNLYEVKDPLPAAYIAHDYVIANTGRETEELAGRAGFDPEKTVILNTAPGIALKPPPGRAQPDAKDSVSLKRPSPDKVLIRTSSPRPGILVLIDTYFEGWSATVDGKNTPILKAFNGFKAVPVTAGNHEIRLKYRPVILYKALPVSVAAWLFIIAGMIVSARRKTGGV